MIETLELPGDILVLPSDPESQDPRRNRAVKPRMLQACDEEPDRDEFDHLLVDTEWVLHCIQAGKLGPIPNPEANASSDTKSSGRSRADRRRAIVRKADRPDVRLLATHLLHCSEIEAHSKRAFVKNAKIALQSAIKPKRIDYLTQEVYSHLFNDIGLSNWVRRSSGEAEDRPKPGMLYPDASGHYPQARLRRARQPITKVWPHSPGRGEWMGHKLTQSSGRMLDQATALPDARASHPVVWSNALKSKSLNLEQLDDVEHPVLLCVRAAIAIKGRGTHKLSA